MAGITNDQLSTIASKIITVVKKDIGSELKGLVTQAVSDLKRGSSEAVEEAAAKAAKKARADEPTFKRNGNRIQYEHNRDVHDELSAAESLIESGHNDEAIERIKNGKKLIAKRNKLIRIADREEDGWDVIKFYESDNLASDSEDEKEISKARRLAAAEKNKAAEKKRKNRKNVSQYSRTNYYRSYYDDRYRSSGENRRESERKYPTDGKRRTVCFLCGKEGHVRQSCPMNR